MIEHVPDASGATLVPFTVQMPVVVEVKVTANPELAVALRLTAPAGNVTFDNAPNVIV